METTHTPEPWSDAPLAKPNIIINEADWTRAVKCVNACAGLTNEQLAELPSIIEEGTIAIAENEKLKAEREELLSVIEECYDSEMRRRKKLLDGSPASTYSDERIKKIELAIAKAKGRN